MSAIDTLIKLELIGETGAMYKHAKAAAAELTALRARIAELERAGIELHNIIDKEPCMVGYEWACEAWRKAMTGNTAALDTRNRSG